MATPPTTAVASKAAVPVVAFVNNQFGGYTPEKVRQLAALTGRVASA
jgi:hypothetical protein